MPNPNTLRQSLREKMEKRVNRRLERLRVTEEEIDRAVAEWDRSSYNDFFSDCRGADKPTARCGAIWNILKERDLAPTGGEEPDDTSDGPTEPDLDVAMPVPETVEELETEFQEADTVYLVVTTGCPSCAQVKEALSDWIDEGVVEVENVQQSDKAADIVIDTGLEALPALVMETDGELVAV